MGVSLTHDATTLGAVNQRKMLGDFGVSCHCNECEVDLTSDSARMIDIAVVSMDLDENEVDDSPKEIPQIVCDFHVLDWIPAGWSISEELPAGGFLYAGGKAVVIEALGSKPPERNVLLAMPEWAVSIKHARAWSLNANRMMVKLRGIRRNPAAELVCLQFDYPQGECLRMHLRESGSVPEQFARNFCRNLMNFCVGLGPAFSLRGFVDSSMVWIHPCGTVSKVLPLGSMLSAQGIKAVARRLMDETVTLGKLYHPLAPEIRQLVSGCGDRIDMLGGRIDKIGGSTDSYAIAVLALTAMVGAQASAKAEAEAAIPSARMADVRPQAPVKTEEVGTYVDVDKMIEQADSEAESMQALTSNACDFLRKALHGDPAYRLTGKDALEHPWIAMKVSRYI